jgi:dihydroneopterin aldolase
LSVDRVIIAALPVDARVGVTAEERAVPQGLSLDVELFLDLTRAGKQDELSATVDYAAVCASVLAVVEARAFHLIEAVADEVAAALLQHYPVAGVCVRVRKPGALRAFGAANAAVEVQRTRHA